MAAIYESYTIEDEENMRNQNFLMRYNKRFSKKKKKKILKGLLELRIGVGSLLMTWRIVNPISKI